MPHLLAASEDGPKIRVVVRKRPLNRKELRMGDLDVIDTVTRRTSLVHEAKQKVDLTRYTETHEFTFDDVFDHTCETAKIYQHTARPLIASVFAGRKATCFAYGQTGKQSVFIHSIFRLSVSYPLMLWPCFLHLDHTLQARVKPSR